MTTRTIALGLILGLGLTVGAAASWAGGPAGDADLAKAKVQVAGKTYEAAVQALRAGKADAERVYLWSRRWMEAQGELSEKKADQVAARETHLQRMKELRQVARALYESGRATHADALATEFYVVEATLWLARAKRK